MLFFRSLLSLSANLVLSPASSFSDRPHTVRSESEMVIYLMGRRHLGDSDVDARKYNIGCY
jgi:hypothetical protein